MDSVGGLRGKMLLFASSDGMVKRVRGEEFEVSKRTTAATKLAGGESLLAVVPLTGAEDETVVMQTERNMFLRFPASEAPEKKKGAIGARGMKIDAPDRLVKVWVLSGGEAFALANGKEVALHRLRVAGRDGKGVKKG